ncbi:ATP-binding protein [Actinoplanes sp. DH11]|uniref:ATP-binding protein n=1 Tax=Actinoplanes sp. DH11 TaxID=2857011 RepID=UPI001E5969A5|nr:ATP-binding protein [Actinoplanes sp. DH11]
MSPSMTCRVESRDGLTVVTVNGTVDARSGPALHRTLSQCLTRDPGAVVVDLSGAIVTDPQAAGTLATILDEAQFWLGTPVLLCTPEAATADVIVAVAAEPPPLYPTVADALSALTQYGGPVSELLLPISGAARRARDVVTEACVRWNIPHLIAPATLVASELVSNAVMHARTMMTLQVTLRPRYLCVAVNDGSCAEPIPRGEHHADATGGRGLHLVDMAADRWGCQQHQDGKVVWARIARSPTDPT